MCVYGLAPSLLCRLTGTSKTNTGKLLFICTKVLYTVRENPTLQLKN